MSDEECDDVKTMIATNPLLGTPIAGGARKLRVAGRGKGKSGGYRVVYFFGGGDIPIFLLTVFGKGEKDNLTKPEQNALAGVGDRLRASLTKT
ncbi:addiction module toxin RelE [Sphingomonas sp. HMWF008]|nr:addiction module toxin RelE [Sphingomonas sp. HMWF008]